MSRLLVVLATLALAMPCEEVNAQGHGRFWNRGVHVGGSPYRHSQYNRYRGLGGQRQETIAGPTLFGFSFGTTPYGYDYAGYPDPYFTYPYMMDPWSRGSFRAPDLLDDPYFYDRVPAAHRHPVARHPVARHPVARHPAHQHAIIQYGNSPVIAPSGPPVIYSTDEGYEPYVESGPSFLIEPAIEAPMESLQSASERLLQNLSSFGGGEAWIEYLSPHRIDALTQAGETAELRELLARFDGVSRNQELRVVAEIHGFAETMFLLQQHLYEANEPVVEPLPSPQPEPILESPANDAAEI